MRLMNHTHRSSVHFIKYLRTVIRRLITVLLVEVYYPLIMLPTTATVNLKLQIWS